MSARLDAGPGTAPSGPAVVTGRGPGWTLALLTLLSALAFMDRQLLAVLLMPVKAEFGLGDLQAGLVTGLGYALAFAAAGVPLGRLADRFARRDVVVWCRGLGGALAALGSLAPGAGVLMATRAGGALSDAGGGPASLALVADLYPPERRTRALSVFSAGASLGALMALLLGAWLAQRHGWRVTVAVVGGGSMLAALALRLTVREPPHAPGRAAPLPLGSAVAAVWRVPVARHLIVATACVLMAGQAFGAWNLSLLVRRHGLDLPAAGLVSASAALASVFGSLLAGALADRLARRDARWQLGVPLLGVALALPCMVGYLLLPAGALGPAVALVLAFALFIAWWAAPVYAALSLVVAPQRRATANAMLMMAGAVLGSGVGPVAVGALSDLAAARLGTAAGENLRCALLGSAAMLLPCLLATRRALHAYPAARAQQAPVARPPEPKEPS